LGEEKAQGGEVVRLVDLGQGDVVDDLGGIREVGVDEDALGVGDDQQGRILERVFIGKELGVGDIEVLFVAFVLPAEVAAFPDIGEALGAGGGGDGALEGVVEIGAIGGGGGGLVEEGAEIAEVFGVGLALVAGGGAPLGPEFLWCHERIVDEARRREGAEARRRADRPIGHRSWAVVAVPPCPP
jgi:hypothetical protein